MEYVILLTGFIILFATTLYFQRKARRFKLPPGPKGYPLFGNSLDVDFNNIHLKLEEWAKEYGEIYRVNIFGRDLIVLNTGDLNREAFLQEPNATNLADRIPGMVGKHFFYDFHDIGFAGFSKETTKRRKLGYRLMKAYGDGMAAIEKCIHDQLVTIIEMIDRKGSSPVDIGETVNMFVCGVIMTLVTGRQYPFKSDLVSTMCVFDHQLTLMMDPGSDFLLHWFPLIKRLPCKVAAEYKKTKWAQNKFFELLIKEMERYPNDMGMLRALYQAKRTDVDMNGQPWITEADIFGILTNLVSAAVLTTKGALLSLIRCLLCRPDVQEKLQKEVDKFVDSDRTPILADRKSMPYTEAVIVISNLWAVHHNENVFTSPFKFDPERFLDSDGELLPYDSEPFQNVLAFGIGKRSCIGEVFARGRMFLFLSTIMQKYTLVMDFANPLPQFHPRELLPGLVRMPPAYKCKFEKRNQ